MMRDETRKLFVFGREPQPIPKTSTKSGSAGLGFLRPCAASKYDTECNLFPYENIGIVLASEREGRAMTNGRKRAAIYLRVSTAGQTVENQRHELEQVAERRGWIVAAVYEDAAVSGAKGRDQRPGFDRMLKDASRRKFDVVMAWAIDRVGRSLHDLLDTIVHLEAVGVDLYLDQQNLDTTTPAGKLLFQITGAFAEFERSMIRQRVNAGLARARAQGKRLGRPTIPAGKEATVRDLLASGTGIVKAARLAGVGVSAVQRVKATMGGVTPAAG
jgi:DNA invertase Pin-like site-specific DNA recombinase